MKLTRRALILLIGKSIQSDDSLPLSEGIISDFINPWGLGGKTLKKIRTSSSNEEISKAVEELLDSWGADAQKKIKGYIRDLSNLDSTIQKLPGFDSSKMPLHNSRISPILATLLSWGIPKTMVRMLATAVWMLLTKLYSKELLASSGYERIIKSYAGTLKSVQR